MVRWSLLVHDLNWKGPLPALSGLLAMSALAFPMTAGESIMPERSVRVASNGANGFERLNWACEGSTATTDWTVDTSLLRGEAAAVRMRLMLATTASALKGVPSWNFTSVRSVKTSCVGLV